MFFKMKNWGFKQNIWGNISQWLGQYNPFIQKGSAKTFPKALTSTCRRHRCNTLKRPSVWHSPRMNKTLMTGWWQLKDFLFSPRSLGKMIQIDDNFSKGLKPPTSVFFIPLVWLIGNIRDMIQVTLTKVTWLSRHNFSHKIPGFTQLPLSFVNVQEDSNRPLEHTPGTAKKYKDFLHKQVFLRVWGMFQVYVRNFPREWSWNSTFCTEEVLELPQSQWQHDYEVKWWKRCRSNAETFWSKTWTCGCFNISKFGDVTFTPFLSMEKNHGLKKL